MSGLAVEKISEISTKPELEGIQTGKIVEINQEGDVYIDFKSNRRDPVKARLTAAAADSITRQSHRIGADVLFAFEENDIYRPVIIDVIHDRIELLQSDIAIDRNKLDDLNIDGETVTFEAKKEIVLRCGKSSITLTKAGKVLIRGAYLLNRSSGVNRIKGGSVQIN